MFTFFHREKLAYNKGQVAPFFILLLVIIVIMAMITVNLSKVSMVKVYTANAADSGGLAGASVMANTFNAIAQANSSLEAAYWEFYASVSVSYAIALTLLALGATLSYTGGCVAHSALSADVCSGASMAWDAAMIEVEAKETIDELYKATIYGIMTAITAFAIAQYYLYMSIREKGEEGRKSAILLALKFAFINSGISSRLQDSGSGNNNRDAFSSFLDGLDGSASSATYSWTDGQGRAHSVTVNVTIDPVTKYKLRTTVMPWWGTTVGLLATCVALNVKFMYLVAAALLEGACVCQECQPYCSACYIALMIAGKAALAIAIGLNYVFDNKIATAFGIIIPTWASLLPGAVMSNSDPDWSLNVCWIEDIDHNKRVRVETTQTHGASADLQLWRFTYPTTSSYSVTDFSGQGAMYPANLHYDASILSTDVLNPVADQDKNCAVAVRNVNALQSQITNLNQQLVEYQNQTTALNAELAKWSADTTAGGIESLNAIKENIAAVANTTASVQKELDDDQAALNAVKAGNPDCF